MNPAHRPPTGRTVTAVTLAAATAVIALAPSALADMPFESKIRLTDRFPAFHGKVKSGSDSCLDNRKVRLFKVKRGPDKVIGKTRTNSAGKWLIEKGPRSGVYYAKVNQYANESQGLVCLSAKSKQVVVD